MSMLDISGRRVLAAHNYSIIDLKYKLCEISETKRGSPQQVKGSFTELIKKNKYKVYVAITISY